MSNRIDFLTPVGRLVQGSLYKPSTKDADGNPLVYKTGDKAGQARVNYFIGIAIPKTAGNHWSVEPWGKSLIQVGSVAWPQAYQSPKFSWKIIDGDDATKNTKGKAPRDNEGFQGNWVLKFSGSYAPKVYREEGRAFVQVSEENYIKPGYFVRVSGSVSGNTSQQNPGIYLNHDAVAFVAYGQEIHFGKDANEVFGAAPVGALPPGASATPLGSGLSLPVSAAPAFTPSLAVSASPVLASAGVQPNPAFLQVPGAAQVAAFQHATGVAQSVSKQMTPKANGMTYESLRGAGFTDDMLVSQGFMV